MLTMMIGLQQRLLLSRRAAAVVTTLKRYNSSTTSTTTSATTGGHQKTPLCWLDLRASGLSVLERLCLEEALLKHDDRNWMCVGTHETTPHRFLKHVSLPSYMTSSSSSSSSSQQQQVSSQAFTEDSSFHVDYSSHNTSCCIVMGLGGKPTELLNLPQVRKDGVWVIKRFSGGGTVVVDPSSIWTTLIGRTQHLRQVEPYPRSIMAYTATLLEPAWQDLRRQQQKEQKIQGTTKTTTTTTTGSSSTKPTMVVDSKSCAVENTGKVIHIQDSPQGDTTNNGNVYPKDDLTFELKENDYVLGQWKMAGNAQSIVKEGWLHHTSFLWDYQEENMNYLTLPSRRPDYRGQRSHDDFLIKLKDVLAPLKPRDFVASLQKACQNEFQVQVMTVRDAMAIVNTTFGSMDACLTKSRNQIMDLVEETKPDAPNKSM